MRITFSRFAGLSMALAMAGTIAFTTGAQAADITWQTPADETGSPGDIVVLGTAFDAVTANASTTVGGVVFRSPSANSGNILSFGAGSHISVSGLTTAQGAYGPTPPSSWDANYRSLVYGGGFAGVPTTAAINLSGLIFGTKYTVQIFESFWDLDWATTYTGGANTSLPVKVAGPVVPGTQVPGAPSADVAQYLTGSFIADGTTETISMDSPVGIVIFDAIQVRATPTLRETAAVPEPSSLALGLTGAFFLGSLRRRRRAAATA